MQCTWAVSVNRGGPPTLEAHRREPGPKLAQGMLLESTAEELQVRLHDHSSEAAAGQTAQQQHPAMRGIHEHASASHKGYCMRDTNAAVLT